MFSLSRALAHCDRNVGKAKSNLFDCFEINVRPIFTCTRTHAHTKTDRQCKLSTLRITKASDSGECVHLVVLVHCNCTGESDEIMLAMCTLRVVNKHHALETITYEG